jgi:hypothetical protein
MNWKKLLENELIALCVAIVFSLLWWEGFRKEFLFKYFLYLFFISFVSFSILIHYHEYLKKKFPSRIPPKVKFYLDPMHVELGPLAFFLFYKGSKILRENYKIREKEHLKMEIILTFIWFFILFLSGSIMLIMFLFLTDKMHFLIIISLSILPTFICYLFLMEKIYWKIFEKLIERYKKVEKNF